MQKTGKEADAVVFIVGYNYIDEGEYVATRESENYTESKVEIAYTLRAS